MLSFREDLTPEAHFPRIPPSPTPRKKAAGEENVSNQLTRCKQYPTALPMRRFQSPTQEDRQRNDADDGGWEAS